MLSHISILAYVCLYDLDLMYIDLWFNYVNIIIYNVYYVYWWWIVEELSMKVKFEGYE